MAASQDIIAWLVPTARNTPADKATRLSANTPLTVSTSSSAHLASRLPTPPGAPQAAIQLAFTHRARRPGIFTLGSDPSHCDVLLPGLAGISKQHCAIGFDAQSRLILDDFSESGTQVWYDWACNGDQRHYSWVLSSGADDGFPSAVRRITLDIQGVRFLVVVNDHSADWEGYRRRVGAFCEQAPRESDCLIAPWDADAAWYVEQPMIQHVFVKRRAGEPSGDVYLWDTSRPWEPMVKASA